MATIKGVWVFNNAIKTAITGLDQDAVLDVLFTSNGTKFSSMCYLTANTEDDNTVCFIYYNGVDSADNVTAVEGFIGNISTWTDDAYKTVDFGTTAQTVPDTFLAWMQENATQQASEGETTPTAESVKSKLQSLLTASNAKTGKSDANLTDAVNTLLEGYGQGGGGGVEFNIAYGDTEPTDTSKLWVKASEPEAVQVTTRSVSTDEHFESVAKTLPTAAYSIAAAAVGKKVYLFGGIYGTYNYLNTINVLDTESNTITTLSTKLPTAAYGIAAAAVGKNIYLFGGEGSSRLATINVFDTENNTITTLSAKLPSSAYGIAAAAVGTKVYLFGGFSNSRIDVFDTESNTITTLSTTLSKSTWNITSAAVGTKVYLFGGDNGSKLNTINVFDTESNTITTLSAKLPTAASSITSAAVGTKVYLFGGYGSSNLATVNVFDTNNNTITTLSAKLPTAANSITSAAVGTKVYLFGGYGGGYLNAINAFVVSIALATNHMLINVGSSANTFNILPTVEIGVNSVYLGNASGAGELVEAALYVNGAWAEI